MRGMVLVGVLLAILGAGALIFDQVRFTETEPVIDAGPIQVNKQEDHVFNIPTVAGAILLIAGLGFVFVGMRKT